MLSRWTAAVGIRFSNVSPRAAPSPISLATKFWFLRNFHLTGLHNKGAQASARWSAAEDEVLLADGAKGYTFASISQKLGSRTPRACGTRWRRLQGSARKQRSDNHRFTSAEDEYIVQQRNAGQTFYQVAKALGRLHPNQEDAISKRYFKLNPTAPRKTCQRITANDYLRLQELRKQGMTWSKIAQLFGRTESAVWLAYQRYASPHDLSNISRQWTAEEEQQLIFSRDTQGLGFSEIGNKLHRTATAVQNAYSKLKGNRAASRFKPWSKEEEALLRTLRDKEGLYPIAIHQRMPHRSVKAVGTKFRSLPPDS